jgi:hypothetical protein
MERRFDPLPGAAKEAEGQNFSLRPLTTEWEEIVDAWQHDTSHSAGLSLSTPSYRSVALNTLI